MRSITLGPEMTHSLPPTTQDGETIRISHGVLGTKIKTTVIQMVSRMVRPTLGLTRVPFPV